MTGAAPSFVRHGALSASPSAPGGSVSSAAEDPRVSVPGAGDAVGAAPGAALAPVPEGVGSLTTTGVVVDLTGDVEVVDGELGGTIPPGTSVSPGATGGTAGVRGADTSNVVGVTVVGVTVVLGTMEGVPAVVGTTDTTVDGATVGGGLAGTVGNGSSVDGGADVTATEVVMVGTVGNGTSTAGATVVGARVVGARVVAGASVVAGTAVAVLPVEVAIDQA